MGRWGSDGCVGGFIFLYRYRKDVGSCLVTSQIFYRPHVSDALRTDVTRNFLSSVVHPNHMFADITWLAAHQQFHHLLWVTKSLISKSIFQSFSGNFFVVINHLIGMRAQLIHLKASILSGNARLKCQREKEIEKKECERTNGMHTRD